MAMPGGSIGTLFVELDLDPSRYMKSNQTILKEAQKASDTLEKNFYNLGIKSGAMYDLQRAQAERSYEFITNSVKKTANDRLRAEEALHSKLNALNEQQYGHQKTLEERLTESYKSIGIHSSAEFDQMRANIIANYNLIAEHAKGDDVVRAEEAKNAKLKALNEEQFGHQKTLEERLTESYKSIGIHSSAEFDQMRANIIANYNLIAEHAKGDDVVRAEEAKNAKLKALNEEQFGHQKTLEERLTESYKSIGIHSSAEFDQMRANIIANYNLIAEHAKGDDVVRAEEAKNAKLKALNEEQYGHQKTLLENLKEHWVAAGAVIYAAMKFERMIAGWSRLAIEQDKVDRTLKAIMITNERYSEGFYQSTIKQAKALQRLTGIKDAEIEASQRILMTYSSISNEAMPKATQAVLDLSVVMGTEGGGLRGATVALGKAMEGRLEGLHRYGIMIDNNTYKLRGAAGVLDEVSKKVAGQSETLGEGSGKWTILGSQIGEATESAGRLFNTISERSGLIDGLTSAVDGLNVALIKLNDVDFSKTIDRVVSSGGNPFRTVRNRILEDIKAFFGGKSIEESGRVGELFTPLPELTPDQLKAQDEVRKWLYDITTSDYEKALEAINNKYERFKSLLGDTAELTKAYRLEVEKLQETRLKKVDESSIMQEHVKAYYKQLELLSKPLAESDIMQEHVKAYYKQLELLSKPLAESDIMQEHVKAYYDNLNKMANEWKKTVEQMGKSFTDAMYDSTEEGFKAFDNFFDKFKEKFIKMWLDKAITQPIIEPTINYIGGILGAPGSTGATGAFAKTMSGSAFGVTGGASYGQMLGAGVAGYAAGGGGTSGLITGLGSAAGMYAGGPVGAIAGGLLGSAINSLLEGNPPTPKISLLYDIIDGEVKKVGESWKHTSRSGEFVDSVSTFFDDQITFYNRLSIITGQKLADFKFNITARGFGDLASQLQGGMNKAVLQMALTEYSLLSQTFGGEFTKGFEDLYAKTFASTTIGFGSGITHNLPTLENVAGNQQSIQSLFKQYNKLHGIGFTQGQDDLAKILGGSLGQEWKDVLQPFLDQMNEIWGNVSQGLGDAFLGSLSTGEFFDFEKQFKQSIFNNSVEGIVEAFMSDTMNQMMGGSGIFGGMKGAQDLLSKYMAGEEGVTANDVMAAYHDSFIALNASIADMKPIYNTFSDGLKSLSDTLGLNTTAITSNTDVIMGPVNSFLQSLDTGPLAPYQSLAKLEELKGQLFAGASANPQEFGALSSFLTSSYLPTQKNLGGDYSLVVSGIRSEVGGIPWVASQGAAPITAADIGSSVGQALAPMLLDLKEAGKITINVVVDGQVVKSAVIDALSDSDVVATIQDM